MIPNNIISFLVVIISLYGIIILFRLIRFLYHFFRYLILSYRYRPRHHKNNQIYSPKKKFSNKNDFKFRDKESEKSLKTIAVEKENNIELAQEKTDIEIVGIAKPLGTWTKFVTTQKMSWLKAMVGSKTDSDKFWQNMIKAQEMASSKQRGRGGRG